MAKTPRLLSPPNSTPKSSKLFLEKSKKSKKIVKISSKVEQESTESEYNENVLKKRIITTKVSKD